MVRNIASIIVIFVFFCFCSSTNAWTGDQEVAALELVELGVQSPTFFGCGIDMTRDGEFVFATGIDAGQSKGFGVVLALNTSSEKYQFASEVIFTPADVDLPGDDLPNCPTCIATNGNAVIFSFPWSPNAKAAYVFTRANASVPFTLLSTYTDTYPNATLRQFAYSIGCAENFGLITIGNPSFTTGDSSIDSWMAPLSNPNANATTHRIWNQFDPADGPGGMAVNAIRIPGSTTNYLTTTQESITAASAFIVFTNFIGSPLWAPWYIDVDDFTLNPRTISAITISDDMLKVALALYPAAGYNDSSIVIFQRANTSIGFPTAPTATLTYGLPSGPNGNHGFKSVSFCGTGDVIIASMPRAPSSMGQLIVWTQLPNQTESYNWTRTAVLTNFPNSQPGLGWSRSAQHMITRNGNRVAAAAPGDFVGFVGSGQLLFYKDVASCASGPPAGPISPPPPSDPVPSDPAPTAPPSANPPDEEAPVMSPGQATAIAVTVPIAVVGAVAAICFVPLRILTCGIFGGGA
jgi:hypothetical protein